MVEGAFNLASNPCLQPLQYPVQILQHLGRRNPQRQYPPRFQPDSPALIQSGAVGMIMGCAVDLDRQPSGMAVEVENPWPDGVLAAKAHAEFPAPDRLP
tara:strand:+ start:417 stop:713 length:297 start_codon:yes stop_codon:yes gene_type:complete